ncbi:MAG: Unknown protein [uncultured Sulfurovum sp.]|uniref:CHAD domain-containing protein n=1 Tax=uncultured Sulfurovum sp. TaxID=269237 RepID=A0A6S6SE03_9BACT|nr:MAG: Unknown protein [uncultured Sulfurovum sp.]
MKEIEKKYLLKDSIVSLIKAHKLYGHKITQFYTTITESKGVRYRQIDDRYFKTVKYGTGASRDEEEIEISQKKFQKKYEKRIKSPVRKNRYLFDYEGAEYSIDVFKKDLKGLYILEIEFPTLEAFHTFELPTLFLEHVSKDVTLDEAYKNKNMTLHGKPSSTYDLVSIFTKLDAMNIAELNDYFIPNLTPIDALRVILYKFSLCILYYKECVLLYDTEEYLHQFRVNIRKSRAFLKEFAFLFSEDTHSYFTEKLSGFASLTNQKRDLDVIKERLIELEETHELIQKDIGRQQESEHQKITQMLEGENFERFFQSYQHTLKENTLVDAKNNFDSIEETAKKVLENLHSKIVKKINALEKKFSIEKLHKIRIAFKKFRYLLEEFQHIFGEEKIEKMIEEGKNLQTLLGDFNDAVNQKNLLHTYFKSNKKKITDRKKLEAKLLKKTVKSQEKLLKEVIKKLHNFKKKALDL